MVDGNESTVAADDLPVADATRPAPAEHPDLPAREECAVDAALARFQQTIDHEVAERLSGDDALQDRLARIRPSTPGTDDALLGYGHTVVKLWLRLVLADERSPVGLAERSLDEIATETVARALVTAGEAALPRAETERKVAILRPCVDHLPGAYRAWRLAAGVLDAEEFGELLLEGETFVTVLRRLLAQPHRVRWLLAGWEYSEEDVDEHLACSRKALHGPGRPS